MSELVKVKERLALLLMSETEDSQKFLLYLVYSTIQKNQGITVNQICTLLNKNFLIRRARIEGAIAALSNRQVFDSITTFHKKQNVVHLRCKESPHLTEWLSEFCSKVPEACAFDAPLYDNGKRS